MFDGNWRQTVSKGVDPIGVSLRNAGVTADALTVAGLVIATIGAVVIGNGYLQIGFVMLLLAGIPDLLDGAVAKASNTASKRGAFFDSTADRVTDALLFGGIAWYLASDPRYANSRIMMLPVAVMASAFVVSYMRAKGELLGFDAKGGIMERAERFIAVSIGLLFPSILIPVLWIMLVLTLVTVGQRFAKIWRQATNDLPEDRRPAVRRSPRPSRERTRLTMAERRARRREARK